MKIHSFIWKIQAGFFNQFFMCYCCIFKPWNLFYQNKIKGAVKIWMNADLNKYVMQDS